MKKLFLYAIAVALTFTSCMQEREVPSGQTRIVVKIAGGGSQTRSVETASATDPTPTISSGYVYVLSASGSVVYSESLTALTSGSSQVIGATAASDGSQRYFADDSEVYIIANPPASVDWVTLNAPGTPWTTISSTAVAISASTGYASPVMANSTGAPAVLSAGADATSRVANISLTPLYSRIELLGIKGSNKVHAFDVVGVHLNNFNSEYTLAGAGKTLKQHDGSNNFADVWGDSHSPALTWSDDVDSGAAIVPATGQVWAHQVGAGTVPVFIVELTNLELYPLDSSGVPSSTTPNAPITDSRYVVVKGYSGFTGSFQRGKIYKVSAIEFDEASETVDPDGVAITANVTIVNWDTETIAPVL